jgi:hypothetical protein
MIAHRGKAADNKSNYCDRKTMQRRTMLCWKMPTNVANTLPPSALRFNSHLASSTGTSQMWNAAALLSSATSAGRFKVKVSDTWEEEVCCWFADWCWSADRCWLHAAPHLHVHRGANRFTQVLIVYQAH